MEIKNPYRMEWLLLFPVFLFTPFYRLDYIFFLYYFFWHVFTGRLRLFKPEGSEVNSTELFVTMLIMPCLSVCESTICVHYLIKISLYCIINLLAPFFFCPVGFGSLHVSN